MDHIHTFLTTQGHGGPPRMKDNTHQAYTHSYQQGEYGMMITMAKWYSGTLGGLKFPDICLTGEEKPQKTSPRKPVPTGDWTRACCVTSAHATTCSTAVDFLKILLQNSCRLSYHVGWNCKTSGFEIQLCRIAIFHNKHCYVYFLSLKKIIVRVSSLWY